MKADIFPAKMAQQTRPNKTIARNLCNKECSKKENSSVKPLKLKSISLIKIRKYENRFKGNHQFQEDHH